MANFKDSLLEVLDILEKSLMICFVPLKIKNCDADFSSHFSNASCYVQESVARPQTVYSFACVFQHGVKVLRTYLSDRNCLPEEKGPRLAVQRLAAFLQNVDSCKVAHKEADWPFVLTHHVLSQLAVDQSYLVDERYPGRVYRCPCCNESIKGKYSDISVGNEQVWHGSLDILIGQSTALKIEEDNEAMPHRDNTFSFENKDESECKGKRHQIIAETIVCAFLQKKTHPDYANFLIPTIGLSNKHMVVYMYDPEHDILLESGAIDLYYFGSSELSITAIVAFWLVVNYQYFCTGITESMKEIGYTADFFKNVNENAQDIYKEHLHFGNCRNRIAEYSDFRHALETGGCIFMADEPLN